MFYFSQAENYDVGYLPFVQQIQNYLPFKITEVNF